MKILVTGGAGFIGSNFLIYMIKKYKNYDFICLDALTYAGNIDNLKEIENMKNYKFILGNITDEELIDNIFKNEKFDIVVNFAAESHVDNSIKNPMLFIDTNIKGTNVLLEACKKYKVKRFHQVSTDEVYGDLLLDKNDSGFDENALLRPSNPYAATKASADLLTLSYARTFNLPITISRCSNNFGPHQHYEKLLPLVIIKALKNENIPIYGNGLNMRDWIYVKDHCRAIDLILHKGQNGNIYNISGHFEKTNIDLVKDILHKLNKPESLISFVQDRPGHDLRYHINSKKIEKLGFKISNNFEKNLNETINYYKKTLDKS